MIGAYSVYAIFHFFSEISETVKNLTFARSGYWV